MEIALNRKYVLLAEDNPDDQRLTLRALQSVLPNMPVVVANDGQDAMERLHDTSRPPPSLLLLDIKMPRLSGLEVVAAVRQLQSLRHVRVVMLTSSDEDRDIHEAYRLGADGYVQKPVDALEFSEVVGELGLYWLGLNVCPS